MEKKGMLVPVLLALAAAGIYWWVLTSKERTLSAQHERATVLVARFDLPTRTIMNVDLVETREIPRMYLEQDAYEVKSQSDIKLVTNLVTSIRIPKGNQITQSALVSLSPEAGLSVKVPPGYRGCVLPLESDLLRLIKPGDRVDILVTFDAVMGDNRKEKVTATILQNVLVLGVGSNLGQGLSSAQAKSKQAAAAAAPGRQLQQQCQTHQCQQDAQRIEREPDQPWYNERHGRRSRVRGGCCLSSWRRNGVK